MSGRWPLGASRPEPAPSAAGLVATARQLVGSGAGAGGARDLRLPVLGAAGWGASLAAPVLVAGPATVRVLVGLALGGVVAAGLLLTAVPRLRATAVAGLLVVLGCGAVTALHTAQVRHNPVADLARERAQVRVEATVTSDPREVVGAFDTNQMVRVTVTHVTGRGRSFQLRTAVLVLGSDGWADVELGERVAVSGRLAASDSGDVAALLLADDPRRVSGPGMWWRGSAHVRTSIREAVAHRPAEQAALVPALVDGDDTGVSDDVADDFRTTGLTHLLAVSGTNLTLVVGFLLLLARWVGVRGRWLYAVGALGIVGFVLLARTEPSVVRAAAMGTVGLLALGHNGLQRGLRGLGAAVLGLLLLDPGLARSVGFTLSVLATAGILLLAPPWRDALAHWMPRWCAEAIAVPAAAQLAVTPVVAAISAEVSLVAVIANLLAEPAVAPATVLGLLGGLVGLVWAPAGRLLGTLASWCVGWIVAVARRCADLPMPEVGWGTGPVAVGLLTVVSLVVALGAPRLLRRRSAGLACGVAMVLVVAVRPADWGGGGDWSVAACDVGQGDAVAVRTGAHSAVVVDAGPDPDLVDACLDDLGVAEVPLLVVTHFHADHVDGVGGVFSGRRVGEVWTARLQDPPEGVDELRRAAAAAGVVPRPATYADARSVGSVRLQVLWPPPDGSTGGPGDGSTANDASVVLLVEVDGLTVLLTGDVEPPVQGALARDLPGLDVDVLKVPHHGSRHQDHGWLSSLRPEVVLVPVGEDNTYGHPAAVTLDPLAEAGADVRRTDVDGTVLVTGGGSGPHVDAR